MADGDFQMLWFCNCMDAGPCVPFQMVCAREAPRQSLLTATVAALRAGVVKHSLMASMAHIPLTALWRSSVLRWGLCMAHHEHLM